MVMLLGSLSYSHVLAAEPSSGANSSASGEGGENAGQLEVVVVTAQRRAERLQDVPITVVAVGGPELASAGISSTTQLQVAVPNLVMNRALGASTPFLRGIGSSTGDVNAEASVALYVDGVYQPSAFANIFELNNIERIEVLNGPQGTLFGRNATGGVVQIVTRPVSFEPEANVALSYANYDTVKTSGYVSGGLSDKVAASLSAQYVDQGEGWGKNLTTGKDVFRSRETNVLGKLLFQVSDKTSLVLSGNYTDFNRTTSAAQPAPGSVLITGQTNPGDFNVFGDTNVNTGETYGGSLTLDHDSDAVGIRSITAYQKFNDGRQTLDQDMSPLPVVQATFHLGTEMFTQEVHLFSPSSAKLQWLAGLFYFDYKAAMDPISITGLVFSPLPGVDLYTQTHVHSIAGFAQATYPLTDQTNLTAGIRYSHDKSEYNGVEKIYGTSVVIDPPQTKEYKKGDPTWRVALDHRFTPDVMGYVSYNRGIKSGNFSTGQAPSVATSYDPEQLDAYEIGLKTELLGRRVVFNTDAFYYDYKNIQFQRVQTGVVLTLNGPSAETYGAEATVEALATDNLTLRASASYLHTRIGNFPNAPNTNRLPSGLNDFGDPNFNAEGNRLPNAPEFSGNVGFQYVYPLERAHIRFGSNLTYAGKTYTELDNRLSVDGHTLLSASLGWESDSGLGVSIWGTNLTDDYYYSMLTAVGGLSDIAVPNAPRTYGVTAEYKFR
jgi:iron complex outermembrane receptor protein